MRKPLITAVAVLSLVAAGCSAKPTAPAAPPSSPAPAPAPADTKPEPPKVDPPKPETPAPAPAPMRQLPSPVRGIVVSGWYAGSPDLLGPLLDWAKSAGINTLIVDIKAEDGLISWQSDIPLAKEIGSNGHKVGDMAKVIKDMHDRGFWVAGRVVTMNDQYLYRGRPSWGIPGFPGGAYSFMDPKNENVWRYNIDIAKAAVAQGVDEIQFDYIRYPEKLVTGYNRDTGADYRVNNVVGFLKQAYSELHPMGVVVGADLFGLTTSVAEGDDMQIGQDYKKVAEVVDYVGAMAYPSHYALGTYGLDNPNRRPYETIKASMGKALERTPGIPMEKHRPWIQDFSLDGVKYGQAEVLAQVRALKDLGITSFMLWDPQDKFTRGIDFSKAP